MHHIVTHMSGMINWTCEAPRLAPRRSMPCPGCSVDGDRSSHCAREESRRSERQCTTCQEGSTGHVKHRFQLLSGLSHALAVASTVIVVDGGVNETRSPIVLEPSSLDPLGHCIMSAEQGRGSVRENAHPLLAIESHRLHCTDTSPSIKHRRQT